MDPGIYSGQGDSVMGEVWHGAEAHLPIYRLQDMLLLLFLKTKKSPEE